MGVEVLENMDHIRYIFPACDVFAYACGVESDDV